MNRALMPLFAALFAGHLHAQTPSVLIEACNAVQDSVKRLECLKAAMGVTPAKPPSAELDTVMRAFSNMQASLNIGISYNNYQLALLDLAKAVATYKQEAGDKGAAAGKLFDSALEAYRDAGTFWEHYISFYARRGNDIAYSGGLPVNLNGLDWLVGRYNLPTTKSDIWGIERGLPVETTRAELWRVAKARAAQGQAAAQPKAPGDISDQLVLPYAPIGDAPERGIAFKIAKGSACAAEPFLATVEDTPLRKEFMTKCDDGKTLKIVCAEGTCRGTLKD